MLQAPPTPAIRLVVSNPTPSPLTSSSAATAPSPRLATLLANVSRICRTAPTWGRDLEHLVTELCRMLGNEANVARKPSPKPARAAKSPSLFRRDGDGYANPRPPALPVGVIKTMREYYAAAIAMGAHAAQPSEADPRELAAYVCDHADALVAEVRARWGRRDDR